MGTKHSRTSAAAPAGTIGTTDTIGQTAAAAGSVGANPSARTISSTGATAAGGDGKVKKKRTRTGTAAVPVPSISVPHIWFSLDSLVTSLIPTIKELAPLYAHDEHARITAAARSTTTSDARHGDQYQCHLPIDLLRLVASYMISSRIMIAPSFGGEAFIMEYNTSLPSSHSNTNNNTGWRCIPLEMGSVTAMAVMPISSSLMPTHVPSSNNDATDDDTSTIDSSQPLALYVMGTPPASTEPCISVTRFEPLSSSISSPNDRVGTPSVGMQWYHNQYMTRRWRHWHGTVVYHNQLYRMGGQGVIYGNAADVFDPLTITKPTDMEPSSSSSSSALDHHWHMLPLMPQSITRCQSCITNDNIYIMGYLRISQNPERSNTVAMSPSLLSSLSIYAPLGFMCYHIPSRTYNIPRAPPYRANHRLLSNVALVSCNDGIMILGAPPCDGGTALVTAQQLDDPQWRSTRCDIYQAGEWKALPFDLPCLLDGLMATMIDCDHLVIIGTPVHPVDYDHHQSTTTSNNTSATSVTTECYIINIHDTMINTSCWQRYVSLPRRIDLPYAITMLPPSIDITSIINVS